MRPLPGLLLALAACSPAAPAPRPTPRPAASVDEAAERRELDARSGSDAAWVQRQQERQSAFLSFQRCLSACKGDAPCEQRCGAPPRQRARCAACSINGRCQVLSEDSAGTLDCCLPLTDERGCIKPAP